MQTLLPLRHCVHPSSTVKHHIQGIEACRDRFTMQRPRGVQGMRRSAVNKQFLLNTVQGLKSHNHREEEEDCWRQHRLERETPRQLPNEPNRAAEQHRFGTPGERSPASMGRNTASDTRQFWAEEKERAMAVAASATASSTRSSADGLFSEESRGIAEQGDSDEQSAARVSKSGEEKGKRKKRKRGERSIERFETNIEESQRGREKRGKVNKSHRRSKKSKKSKKSTKREKKDRHDK